MDGGSIYALAIDPQTPSTLYAGTYGGGLFKSENAGASWNESNSGLTNLFIKTLAINPQIPTTLYAGTLGVECSRARMEARHGLPATAV